MLNSLARTLFMVFGVLGELDFVGRNLSNHCLQLLGAISLIVAFGVMLMIRYSRNGRGQQPHEHPQRDEEEEDFKLQHIYPYDSDFKDGFRVTIHVSDTSSIIEPTSLTDSEKAIITSATTPENEVHVRIQRSVFMGNLLTLTP